MELGVSLCELLEICVLEDVFAAADRQKLQPLDFGYTFDSFQGRGGVVELVSAAKEEAGAGEIHHGLIDLSKFKKILWILPQEDSLVVGLDSLPALPLPLEFPRILYLIRNALVDDLIFRSLFHFD